MTYHRLLTHRSFATRPRWVEYLLTAIGCCASEGGPISWVADHRNHHAHSDGDARLQQGLPRKAGRIGLVHRVAHIAYRHPPLGETRRLTAVAVRVNDQAVSGEARRLI